MQTIRDPIIVVNGDLKHRDISGALNDVGDFALISPGPTRGAGTIDQIYTNVDGSVVSGETRTLPPLKSGTGVDSDHRCIYAEAILKPTRNFKWTVKFRRVRDINREVAFTEELARWDWSGLSGGVDDMADQLSGVIANLTQKHFPLARVRMRSNESPWITGKIRKLRRRKIRLYKKKGRSDAWWRADSEMQERINESGNSFVDRLLEEGGGGKSFYAATRKLSTVTPASP